MRNAPTLLVLLLLAACGRGGEPETMTNGAAPPAPGEPDNRIECQAQGSASFERACSVESADSPRGRVLTLRKADGGFRRLLRTDDGRGVVAADGAEAAHVTLMQDGRIEVEIGGDRFRLPATVRRP
jgi:hypothetical protein